MIKDNWFGSLPSQDWEVTRLKNVVISVKNGIWGDEPLNNSDDIACIRIADFDRKKNMVKDKEFTLRNVPRIQAENYLLKKGDLLIEKSGGGEKQPVGFVVQYNLDKIAVYANFMAKIELDLQKVDSTFMNYVFSTLYAVKANLKAFNQTTGIQNLNTTAYLNELFLYPSLKTQQAIVNFLNEKTNLIDKTINSKQNLLDLLEQQRQSIITEAVTKGLKPNVKMKDSGVEWIGEIPEDWNTIKLKFISEMKSGTSIDSININETGDYRVYGGGELRGYTEDFTHDGEYVIVGRQGANCGQATFVTGKIWATEHAVVVATKKVLPRWLYYVLKSMNLNQYSMSAAQPGIAVSTILNLSIPYPTMEQQQVMLDFLTKYDAEITKLLNDTVLQIEKLKEYRQALIYEAVTGKIDVRELGLD